MYSCEKTVPACRRYLAYARSTTTWRQVSPARSTSSLKWSTSDSPCQAAEKAFSTLDRAAVTSQSPGGRVSPKS